MLEQLDIGNDKEGTILVKRTRPGNNGKEIVDDEPPSKVVKMPQKKYYRQRAHVNPLSFNNSSNHYRPTNPNPESMEWDNFFGPSFQGKRDAIKNLDVGCGYGGLLFKLSEIFSEEGSVGMEIRDKVSRFVQDKITAMRHNEGSKWDNICCFRTNAMKYLPNFFQKNQLERMFFLYPDPHFKKKKIKWRIISMPLIAQYAYFIRAGGLLYTVTDVLQYHEWVLENFMASKLFEKVSDEELKDDPIFPFIFDASEEGKKVTRNNGKKYHAIYRRTSFETQFKPDLSEQPADDEEEHEEEESEE